MTLGPRLPAAAIWGVIELVNHVSKMSASALKPPG